MATTKTTAKTATENVWTDEERAAMQASARERKAAARKGKGDERADGEREIQAKIADLVSPERELATRVHELVTSSAPELMPRTYYGMPAYAKNGKTVCFFKPASKFKERYSTFGFEQIAALDDGEMWPVAFAVTKLTPEVERRIVELVKRAAG
jgi:uncharacterized protein YdhG (YjbR/CyaY superfamily)